MEKWECTIEKVSNGYLICSNEGYKVVEIQNDCDTKDEQLALRDVFYILMEYFAVHNDKHANGGKGQYMTIKVDQ